MSDLVNRLMAHAGAMRGRANRNPDIQGQLNQIAALFTEAANALRPEPTGTHCADCTDPHCRGSALRAVPLPAETEGLREELATVERFINEYRTHTGETHQQDALDALKRCQALLAAPAGATAPIDPIYFMSKMLEGLAAGDADKSLAYARHYIEQLEASGSASQAKRLRDAMDGTARMVGLAAPAGAHCNDCTDPHCHGAAPAVSREASVPQVGELERVRLRLIALWGDPEDCEDCAVIESRPCRVHANWENGE
jgi:hypothetical protein